MGKGQLQRAGDHLFHVRLLVVVAEVGDQAAAQDGGVEKGFDHAGTAQFLEHGGDVETRTPESALVFGKERADHAQFGQFGPDFGRHAAVAFQDLVAHCGAVFVAQIASERVLKHLAFFCQFKIHGLSSPS